MTESDKEVLPCELLVVISVTALLAAMLFTITTQVLNSDGIIRIFGNEPSCQFILDRIQEDRKVLYNDGNNWFVATILGEEAR